MAEVEILYSKFLADSVESETMSVWKLDLAKRMKVNNLYQELDDRVISGEISIEDARAKKDELKKAWDLGSDPRINADHVQALANYFGENGTKTYDEIRANLEKFIDGYKEYCIKNVDQQEKKKEKENADKKAQEELNKGVVHHSIGGITKHYDEAKCRDYNFYRAFHLKTGCEYVETLRRHVSLVRIFSELTEQQRNNGWRFPYTINLQIEELPSLELLLRKLNLLQAHVSNPYSFQQEPDNDGIIRIAGRKVGDFQIMLDQRDDQTNDIMLSVGLIDKVLPGSKTKPGDVYSALVIRKPNLFPKDGKDRDYFEISMSSEGLPCLLAAVRWQMDLLKMHPLPPDDDEAMVTGKFIPRELCYKPNLTEAEKKMKEEAKVKLNMFRQKMAMISQKKESSGEECMDFDNDPEVLDLLGKKKKKKKMNKKDFILTEEEAARRSAKILETQRKEGEGEPMDECSDEDTSDLENVGSQANINRK